MIGGTEGTGHEAEAKFQKKTQQTKSVLRLPDLEHAKAVVLNSLNSVDAKRGYGHAIDEFVDWYCSEPLWFAKTPSDREINNIAWCHLTTVLPQIHAMFRFVGLCFGILVRLFRERRSLLLENLVLRQQLGR